MSQEKNQENESVQAEKTEPAYKKLLAHEQIEHLEKELSDSETKAQENWDKLLRAMAELENVKRRAERDVSSAHKYALDRFVDELIPVMDSLDQALLNCSEDLAAMREGISLTQKMFADVLKKFRVTILNPVGEPFDANRHEAMMMQESVSEKPNTVLTVIQKGYALNDRLIRPARVIVTKESNS